MTLSEAIQRIKAAKEALIQNRERDVLIIASDQLALIKYRVTSSGKDETGQPFAGYSPGYKKQREKKGFQVEHFDFTRTGQAWGSIRPVVVKSGLLFTTVAIQGESQLTKDKLGGQFKKRGNILEPTQNEIDLVKKANMARIKGYLSF